MDPHSKILCLTMTEMKPDFASFCKEKWGKKLRVGWGAIKEFKSNFKWKELWKNNFGSLMILIQDYRTCVDWNYVWIKNILIKRKSSFLNLLLSLNFWRRERESLHQRDEFISFLFLFLKEGNFPDDKASTSFHHMNPDTTGHHCLCNHHHHHHSWTGPEAVGQ